MRSARAVTEEVELDLGRYELRRFGRRVKLEKKSMELLILLVSRREQLVSKMSSPDSGARISSSIPIGTSTTSCENSAQLWETTRPSHVFSRP
jgi:hypothetical protein